ncbi:MAG: LysR family transcriptional regulator [Burkholderiaceae bacterium]
MDRLAELELLVKVADCGSLTQAAEALGLSKPAASRHLAALEERLNTRLVERNTRRLFLTEEGLVYLERARHILGELREADAVISSKTINPTGVLRVSASLSFAMQQIAPRLARFRERYPQLRVHVEVSNRYLDMIDNDIDVAIRTREFEPDSSITIRRLAATRRVLCASPAYVSRMGTPRTPADLDRHDFLLYVLANRSNELRLSRGGEMERVQVQGVLTSNDGQVLRAAALKGMGILVQPSYIVYDDIVSGRLIPILNEWDLPRLQINIAYQSRRYPSAKVRAFVDFLATEFAAGDFERRWTGYMGLQSADRPG